MNGATGMIDATAAAVVVADHRRAVGADGAMNKVSYFLSAFGASSRTLASTESGEEI